jgi:hypothetical protein
MRALSAEDLLNVWDVGQHQCHWDRALTLLSAANPGNPRSALAELSVGERDRLLLRLRQLIFGTELESVVDCPSCGERLQLALRAADLFAAEAECSGQLESNGYRIEYRPPTGADLEYLRGATSVAAARALLLERCVIKAAYLGESLAVESLPAALIQEVSDALEKADPQGNVELAMECAGCGHHWRQLFDIVAFFWAEIHAWAMRAFYEVHRLACAYGWSESEIIQMNPARRQIYLEMLGT